MTNEENTRPYFLMYRSFYDCVSDLPEATAKEFVFAVTGYGLFRKEPDFRGRDDEDLLSALWTATRPVLEKSFKMYDNGKHGGAPAGNRNNPYGRKGKPTKNQPKTKQKPSYNIKDNIKDQDQDSIKESKEIYTLPEEAEKKEKYIESFFCPSLRDVEEYARETGFPSQAGRFYDHNEATGWMMGGNPIKDWKAAFRSWTARSGNAPDAASSRTYKGKEIYQ